MVTNITNYSNFAYWKVFGWLIWRDARVLRQDIVNSIIDAMVMPATFIIVSGYILPYLGMPSDYGAFMIVSSLVMMCYATTNWRGASQLISDLEGERAISYELTLPLPSWLVFIKYSCVYAIDAFFLNILTLPVGKALLWNSFDISKVHIPKFLLMYITVNLFFGAFSTCLASWVKGQQGFSRFWLRYGSQLVFFSGFQFPYSVLPKVSQWFSTVILANPFLYAFEGLRAAVLGQEGSLNYWLCLAVLWFSTIVLAAISLRFFKKKLDYVD